SAFQKPFWSVDENTAGPKAFDLHALLAAVLKKANGKNVNLSEAEQVAVKGLTAIADGLVGKSAPVADATPKDGPVADGGTIKPEAPLLLTQRDPMEVAANS